MGNGQVGGNGSVKWRFRHHNPAGNQQPIKARPGQGSGPHEVGDAGGDAEGLDTIAFNNIGVKHGHPGFFKVTLAGHGEFFVRAVDRSNNQNPNVPMEIQIDW